MLAGAFMALKEGVYNSEQVKTVQLALNQKMNAKLVVDRDYGPNTEAAVRKFQQAVGIQATGVVDENTWNLLTVGGVLTAQPYAYSSSKEEYGPPAPTYAYSVATDYRPSYVLAPTMSVGDSGDAVRQLQIALNTTMGAGLQVDRILGTQTKKAIQDFQFSQGLQANGVADSLTQQALFASAKGQPIMLDTTNMPGVFASIPWYLWAAGVGLFMVSAGTKKGRWGSRGKIRRRMRR